MLKTLPDSESSPPLYYVVVWLWSGAAGTSEVGLRALSALFGVVMVPVAYAVGWAFLRCRGAALAVASFAAVSPILVWYSQEARAYALYALLSSLSMLFFAWSLEEPSRRNLAAWSACSTLAVSTHYFAVFLVVGEVLLLLLRLGRRIAWPLSAPVLTALALAPLALYQHGQVGAAHLITAVGLLERIEEVGRRFVFLYYNPGGDLALAVAVAAIVLLAYRGRGVGRAAFALVLAASVVGCPLALALLGIVDVFHFRNMLAAWLPLAVAVAAGLPRSRLGVALAFLTSTVATATRPGLQRDSWREAVQDLRHGGARESPILARPDASVTLPYYWPDLCELPAGGVRVREIRLVGRYFTPSSKVPTLPHFQPIGFRIAGNMRIVRLRAPTRELLRPNDLSRHRLIARIATRCRPTASLDRIESTRSAGA